VEKISYHALVSTENYFLHKCREFVLAIFTKPAFNIQDPNFVITKSADGMLRTKKRRNKIEKQNKNYRKTKVSL